MRRRRGVLDGLGVGALALVLASCAAAPAPSVSPASPPASGTPQQVVSDDGALQLDVPSGSLPAGVSLNEITVRHVDLPAQDVATGAPFAVYELKPEGLIPTRPLPFHLLLAGHTETLPIVSLASQTGTDAALDSFHTTIDVATDSATIEGEIAHFSVLTVAYGFFRVAMTEPYSRAIRDIFSVSVEVTRTRVSEHVLTTIVDGKVAVIKFSVPGTQGTAAGPPVAGYIKLADEKFSVFQGFFEASAPPVSPDRIGDAPDRVASDGGQVKIARNFQCAVAGTGRILHNAYVEYSQEIDGFVPPEGADPQFQPTPDMLTPIPEKTGVTKQAYTIVSDVTCANPVPTSPPGQVITPSPKATPSPTPTPQKISMNNNVTDQSYARCSFTGTVVWTPSDPADTLTGQGVVDITGPTLTGTRTVPVENNQVRLRLEFKWARTPRSWTVTLTKVGDLTVSGGSTNPNGSQYTYKDLGSPNC